MNKIIKNTLILTVITVVSGLLLGIVYDITKEPIAAAQEAAKQEAFRAVLPDASSFVSFSVSSVHEPAPAASRHKPIMRKKLRRF